METSLKPGFAQIFSCCPKNLSCPKFGGAAASLAPPARTPMVSSMNTLLAILKVTDARRDVILAGGLYHRFPWRHLPPGFTSKTGGFESYDSHQLLCSWKVEVNSEPFCIARFPRGIKYQP